MTIFSANSGSFNSIVAVGLISASTFRGNGSQITSVTYANISGLPTLVSSSTQVISNLPTGTVSSSTQVTALLPTNTVSASAQVQLNSISGTTFSASNFTFPQQLTVSGVLTATSMSVQYVTSSQLIVTDNKIAVNTTDLVRFGGLSVYDSGSSSPTTASIYWDGLNHKFLYENLSGSSYNSGIFIAGPKNTGTLGNEVGLVDFRVPVSHGDDHIDSRVASSSIRVDFPSKLTHIEAGLYVTGAISASGGINAGNGLYGTLQTAAQTNVTSVGTLSSLTVSGTASITGVSNYLRINTTGTPTTGTAALQISVNGTNSRTIRMTNTEASGRTYDLINGAAGVPGNLGLYDDTAGAYRLMLSASGNVGIGTTNPNGALALGIGLGIALNGQRASAGALSQIATYNNQVSSTTAVTNIRFLLDTDTTGTEGAIAFDTKNAERMRIDSAGILGLGGTPNAWIASDYRAIHVGSGGGVIYGGQGAGFSPIALVSNAYVSAGGTEYTYITNSQPAGFYRIQGNDHTWGIAAAGTGTVAFTTAMRLDTGGNLLVGTTSAYRAGRIVVKSTNCTQTSTTANVQFSTTDTQAANIGASIGLGGQVGGDEAPFGYISGRKENSTSGNYGGYLAFATPDGGGTVVERGRFTAAGYFKASNDGTYLGSTSTVHELRSNVTDTGATLIVHNFSTSCTSDNIFQIRAKRNTTNNTFYAMSYYNEDAAAYKFRIADSGAVSTAGSIQIGDAGAPPTSGIGIKFPATQNASSDANTLDDYEEGTFTPTLYYQNATGVTRTYTTQNGGYTKIGNTVHWRVYLAGATSNSGTYANDNMGIAGLPFTANTTDGRFLGPVTQNGFAGTATVGPLVTEASGTTFVFLTMTGGTSNLAEDLGAGATYVIEASGTYTV